MRAAAVISLCAAVVAVAPAFPTDQIVFIDEDDPLNKNTFAEVDDNSTDTDSDVVEIDEDLTNQLKEIGQALFGQPKNESGDAVRNWDPKSGRNPEELSGYVQGDMLIPADLVGDRNGLTARSARWPKGKIPFVLSSSFSRSDRSVIADAMAEYHRRTCIRWVPRKRERNYVYISNQDSGCWSAVGRMTGKQELNLQSGNPGCLVMTGTAIHELMHTVGFMHEQNRWERDNYVTIHYENMESDKKEDFRKFRRRELDDQGVAYDYNSVMHYSANAFSRNGRPTIVPKQRGITIGQRDMLSEGDVLKINRMYKCKL